MVKRNPVILSASRISDAQKCSWAYWCRYGPMKVPSQMGDGANRGTVVHTVFECLLNPRHKKHYTAISKNSSVSASPAVARMVKRLIKRHEVTDTPENLELIHEMILVGLNEDFFIKGSKSIIAEQRFQIENKKPVYTIKGFIDKLGLSPDGATICDYKSSKAKFGKEDVKANIQAMMYALAVKKLHGLKAVVRFIFLRFARKAVQEVSFSDKQLAGFEKFLAYMSEYLSDFDEKKALTNCASDDPKRAWNCKRGSWTCPFLNPSQYYLLLDKNGEAKWSSFKKDSLKPREGEKVIKRSYAGCPRHNLEFF